MDKNDYNHFFELAENRNWEEMTDLLCELRNSDFVSQLTNHEIMHMIYVVKALANEMTEYKIPVGYSEVKLFDEAIKWAMMVEDRLRADSFGHFTDDVFNVMGLRILLTGQMSGGLTATAKGKWFEKAVNVMDGVISQTINLIGRNNPIIAKLFAREAQMLWAERNVYHELTINRYLKEALTTAIISDGVRSDTMALCIDAMHFCHKQLREDLDSIIEEYVEEKDLDFCDAMFEIELDYKDVNLPEMFELNAKEKGFLRELMPHKDHKKMTSFATQWLVKGMLLQRYGEYDEAGDLLMNLLDAIPMEKDTAELIPVAGMVSLLVARNFELAGKAPDDVLNAYTLSKGAMEGYGTPSQLIRTLEAATHYIKYHGIRDEVEPWFWSLLNEYFVEYDNDDYTKEKYNAFSVLRILYDDEENEDRQRILLAIDRIKYYLISEYTKNKKGCQKLLDRVRESYSAFYEVEMEEWCKVEALTESARTLVECIGTEAYEVADYLLIDVDMDTEDDIYGFFYNSAKAKIAIENRWLTEALSYASEALRIARQMSEDGDEDANIWIKEAQELEVGVYMRCYNYKEAKRRAEAYGFNYRELIDSDYAGLWTSSFYLEPEKREEMLQDLLEIDDDELDIDQLNVIIMLLKQEPDKQKHYAKLYAKLVDETGEAEMYD